MAVQAAVMWNVVYNPLETVITPVIRGNPWGLNKEPINDDWPYVIFEWDTQFAAFMLSLDAKELGYSTLIQVIKGKSATGYLPNTAASTWKAGHSQPPVGAKVLHEIFRRYGETWLVELLYEDLLDWSNWWARSRSLDPLGITALGGEDMVTARRESGMDNSPMYDGDFFVGQPFGLMQLYDVGMASLVVMSDEALASLANMLNHTDDADMLHARVESMRAKIDAHLWDEASGAYVNRFPNGSFYRHLSTSFYPMLAAAARPERAVRLVNGWLLNSCQFCLSRNGDFAGNRDECYWGLPSISADDGAATCGDRWRC